MTSYKLFGLASRWHKDLALVTATLAILISIKGMSLIYVACIVTSFIAPHASYQNDDNLTSTYEGLNFVFNNWETVEIDLFKAPNTEELYWSVFMLNGDRVFLDLTNMSVIAENLWIAGLTDFLSELHSIRFLGCPGQPFLLLFGLVMSLIFFTGISLWWPARAQFTINLAPSNLSRNIPPKLHQKDFGIVIFFVLLISIFAGTLMLEDIRRNINAGRKNPKEFVPKGIDNIRMKYIAYAHKFF